MFWHGYGYGGWLWLLMGLGKLVFWALVAVGIVVLIRRLSRRDDAARFQPPATWPAAPPESAEQVLAMRFARGEIDEEEYSRRLATLRSQPPAG